MLCVPSDKFAATIFAFATIGTGRCGIIIIIICGTPHHVLFLVLLLVVEGVDLIDEEG